MSRTILTLTVALCLIGVGSAHTVDTGTIVGRVKLKPRIGGAALASTAYPTRTVGPKTARPIPEIKNVVVYVRTASPFRGALPGRKVEIRQEHETFVPHVVALPRGSSVEFPNDDPIFHNVFSLSSGSSFNLGRYPTGDVRSRAFGNAGTVKVYCNIHSHMSATIRVFDHPYFTIPDLEGAFELGNVPAGDHVLVGWHERVGERVAAVRVEPGRTVSVDLSLPVEEMR